ncbi:hypothetical protein G7046_g1766 [Stylonectria norvegica]|nr:hypothetical protein G7046_g1766 [Stylonectria norvegica]
MYLKAVLAALVASTSVLGAPLAPRDDNYFTPSAIWKYNVGTGAISATDHGLVSKDTNNNGNDITTLMTITYPDEVAGKKCQFAFYLDDTATLSGSGKLDIFTSNSPAPGPTSGWGPGNQRNNNVGRISAVLGGFATIDASYDVHLSEVLDCQPPGTVEAFELVGVYDNDVISWDPNVAGPWIYYS